LAPFLCNRKNTRTRKARYCRSIGGKSDVSRKEQSRDEKDKTGWRQELDSNSWLGFEGFAKPSRIFGRNIGFFQPVPLSEKISGCLLEEAFSPVRTASQRLMPAQHRNKHENELNLPLSLQRKSGPDATFSGSLRFSGLFRLL
jgi:hypothetical protein